MDWAWTSRSAMRRRRSVIGTVSSTRSPGAAFGGFGFGAVKGLIGATLLFLLLVLVFDVAYGSKAERPEWMTKSRTYPLLNASGEALSEFIRERQAEDDKEGNDAG